MRSAFLTRRASLMEVLPQKRRSSFTVGCLIHWIIKHMGLLNAWFLRGPNKKLNSKHNSRQTKQNNEHSMHNHKHKKHAKQYEHVFSTPKKAGNYGHANHVLKDAL